MGFIKEKMTGQFPFSLMNRGIRRNRASLVLYFSMLMMGACGLAYEYTLSSVAANMLGNSTRQWALIIGVMMFFMGLGSERQKLIPDTWLLDGFIGFEILLACIGGWAPLSLLMVYGQATAYYALIQYLLIAVVGLIIGLEIPLISRINQAYISEMKINLGSVLQMDYIGSLLGAVVWSFLLIPRFTLARVGFILGFASLSAAGITLLYFRKKCRKPLFLILFFSGASVAMAVGFLNSGRWNDYAEQFLYRDRIIFSHTSRYQHIVLTRSRSGVLRCYINGHIQFSGSDESIYHELLVHPALLTVRERRGGHLPLRVLILGGGDGLALREVLKYDEVDEAVLCDLDPMMTDLAANNRYFRELNRESLKDARIAVLENNAIMPTGGSRAVYDVRGNKTSVTVINIDAYRFADQFEGLFDVVIIDFPDPNDENLAALYSRVFYRRLRSLLTPGGVIAQQSASPVHASDAFLCIGKTIRSAGFSAVPYHDNVPSFGEWGWWIAGRDQDYDESRLRSLFGSIESIPVETDYLTPDLMRASLIFSPRWLDDEGIEVNTLGNRAVYRYYLGGWDEG